MGDITPQKGGRVADDRYILLTGHFARPGQAIPRATTRAPFGGRSSSS